MEFGVQKIKLSRVDLKKGLILPTKLSEDLAYLSGVLAGDGNIHIREHKHDFAIKCVGHPKDEKEFYDIVIKEVFKNVFGFTVNPRLHDKGTTYGISFSSKAVVNFLTDVIGLPKGAKAGIIVIPTIFQNSNSLIAAFIEGLADTDFCLNLKKRKHGGVNSYPVIVGASKSKKVLEQVVAYLNKLNFRVCTDFDRPQFDKRLNKSVVVHLFYINGHNQLVKWMQTIGFRSPKHLRKFELWKLRNKDNPRAKDALKNSIAGVGFPEINSRLNSSAITRVITSNDLYPKICTIFSGL